jgi:hypothetical protein
MPTLPARLILALPDLELSALHLVVAAGTAAVLVEKLTRRHFGRRTRATPRRAATPSPFSYWYALVPFERGDGAKERPVLVLRLEDTTARVLKVTSKAKPGRVNYRRIDTSRWDRPGRGDGSWLQTDKVTTIPLASFRRCLGDEHNTYFRRELARIHPNEFSQPDATTSVLAP